MTSFLLLIKTLLHVKSVSTTETLSKERQHQESCEQKEVCRIPSQSSWEETEVLWLSSICLKKTFISSFWLWIVTLDSSSKSVGGLSVWEAAAYEVRSSVLQLSLSRLESLSLSKNWTICFLSIFSVAKHEMILLWVLSSFPLTEADTTEPTDSGDSKNASQVDTKGVYKRSRITKRKANKSVEQKRNLSFCVTKLTWKVTWDRSEQRKGGLFRNKQTSTQLSLSLTYPFLEKKRPNAY